MVAQTLKCPVSSGHLVCLQSVNNNIRECVRHVLTAINKLSPSGWHVRSGSTRSGLPLPHALHAQHEEAMEPIPDLLTLAQGAQLVIGRMLRLRPNTFAQLRVPRDLPQISKVDGVIIEELGAKPHAERLPDEGRNQRPSAIISHHWREASCGAPP